jgi:hypothetical protein
MKASVLTTQYLENLKREGIVKTEAMKAVARKALRRLILIMFVAFVVGGLLGTGVVLLAKYLTEWGAEHQLVFPRVLETKWSWPVVVIERPKKIVVSEVTEKVAKEELTPTEQKIMDRWGYKDGVVALAIFDCGESGLDQYAVSPTGDLGVAQINWATWKGLAKERFGYNAADMFDVDKNLNVAYVVWDRGDGAEGNGKGSWGDGVYQGWSGFNNGRYTKCFK